VLTPEHVEILILAREFYAKYGFSPSMRPLIKTIAMNLSIDKAHSIYLMKLFPQSPAKIVAKLWSSETKELFVMHTAQIS
jgi:tRNA 2-thiouridine synthesizing protein E